MVSLWYIKNGTIIILVLWGHYLGK
jgi:hypothetical protein